MTTTINTSSTGISSTTSLFSTFSATPISITGTTSQKALLVSRIPASALSPNCKINLQFAFSRNKTGSASLTYWVCLNDYIVTAFGRGESIISTAPMSTSGNDVRREGSVITIGSDVRQQKFAQNNVGAGGVGNLNKVMETAYNGAAGLAIVVAAQLGSTSDRFTIEDYRIEVTK